MKFQFIIILLFTSIHSFGQTPLLENHQLVNQITGSLEYIYNLENEKSDSCIMYLESKLGSDHPGISLIKAIQIYWRSRPLARGNTEYDSFVGHLTTAFNHAEEIIDIRGNADEAVFYCLAASALLAELYSEEGVSLKVVNEAARAYRYLKLGFEKSENFPDFLLSNGIYKYYREKYPELRPFYNSFLWLFPTGSMTEGIEDLKNAESEGIFTRQMASFYLFHIYLRYENDASKALPFAEKLFFKYPKNNQFKISYAESLIATKRYSMAEPYVDELVNEKCFVFSVPGYLFKGMIFEGYENYTDAKKYYETALALSLKMDKSEAHFVSMIYAGLARIAIHEGDHDKAGKLYRTALNQDPYVPVMEEARNYLN